MNDMMSNLSIKKFMIVDDHEVSLIGIKTMIETERFWKVWKTAKTGHEAILESSNDYFDLIILDYYLPDLTGLETAQMILKKQPDRKIVILSSIRSPALKSAFIQAGISGYVFKSDYKENIILAIRKILSGEPYFSELDSSQKKPITLGPFKDLTPRELEIVIYTSKGYSQKEIATKMKIALKTVEIHKRNLIKKLGRISDIEMAKMAISWGLIHDDFLVSIHE